MRDYAGEQGAKLGVIAQPLRAAATGRTTSPGIFDVLAVLGREESLGRGSRDQAQPGLESPARRARRTGPHARAVVRAGGNVVM